jgi:Ca-activated chloride channel family protein
VTDDLDALRAALRSAPSPEPHAKARAIALAMENFDQDQGSTDPDRSSQDRPDGAGNLSGVRRMLNFLASRPALAMTTSAAALVIGVAVVLPVADLRLSRPGAGAPEETANPEARSATAPAGGADAELAQDVPFASTSETAATAAAIDALDRGDASSVAVAEPAPEGEAPPLADLAGTLEALPAAPQTMAEEAFSADASRTRSERKGMPGIAPEAAIAPSPDILPAPVENTEAFANEAPNPVKVTAEEPVSTFSIDVDTASYAVVRSSLTAGYLPTPDEVRIEEMVNYFPYAYPVPTAEEAFSSTVSVMPTPWNAGTRLVTIGIQGALPEVAARPPLNLVFLVDTSGSMEDANKLPLLKQSLSVMLSELRPEDQVAIVTYAGSAGLVLAPTTAADRGVILAALENLSAGGSTAGAEGLELAYQVAEGMLSDGEVSRILLATDGDFNVGVSDPEGLEAYVARKRATGTYLSVLGFGRGNLDDAVMQSLAQNGNGTAAYIDTLSEARKVLVDQLTGALFPIADDVKIQVEWNPAVVAEYRLIGYETRALRREDFNNDRVDAGEIGAGTQVTAIYEVTAPGSDALLNDPLRYGTKSTDAGADELGFLRLRWKAPGADTSTLIETPITGREEATDETRFAAAMAGFGQLLQNSVYLGDWGWDEAIALALSARGDDPYGYRIEAVNLMRLAQGLAAQ